MAAPLLATKLYIPPVRPELVARPRLIELLDAGIEQSGRFARRLTLVCAPAGYGKTTLLSEWIEGRPGSDSGPRFAWLSLDEADNDPGRFLTYLIAALQLLPSSLPRPAAHAARAAHTERIHRSIAAPKKGGTLVRAERLPG